MIYGLFIIINKKNFINGIKCYLYSKKTKILKYLSQDMDIFYKHIIINYLYYLVQVNIIIN